MKLIFNLSLRNLFRQRRRNLLLGVVIAFGIMVLMLFSSIGDGMADIILNKLLVNWVGHIQIVNHERLYKNISVIRDKERMKEIIQKQVKNVKAIHESISVWTRGIGNGSGADIYVDGIEPGPGFMDTLQLEYGSPADFTNSGIENGVIITRQYARKLRVALNDYIKISLHTIYGQVQSARLRVVGITKAATSIFISDSVYIKISDIKKLMGYRDYETDRLLIILNDPETTRRQADILYKGLQAETACIPLKEKLSSIDLLGFSTNEDIILKLSNQLKLIKGNWGDLPLTNMVIISAFLAEKISAGAGSQIKIIYKSRWENIFLTNRFQVGGIFQTADPNLEHVILLNEKDFLDLYRNNLPEIESGGNINSWRNSPAAELFTKEWIMMPRAKSSDEIEKNYAGLNKNKAVGVFLGLTTMYEEGTDTLQYAALIQMTTFFGFIILFFITQIGVVNTLRMSIKERTREIGTMRSIGMRKIDVRNLFISETVLLTFFGSAAGIVLSYIVMWLLSLLYIETTSNAFSIFILNNHLHFVTSPANVALFVFILLIIAVIASFFPAGRAANLSSADALRHYE